jgi:hypothetical protein
MRRAPATDRARLGASARSQLSIQARTQAAVPSQPALVGQPVAGVAAEPQRFRGSRFAVRDDFAGVTEPNARVAQ